MAKVIEKRDWENVWARCAPIQDAMLKCVTRSRTFKYLDPKEKNKIRTFAGSYIFNYISLYTSDSLKNVEDNTSSDFKELSDECNFAKLHECCKDNYNLESLKGYYESTIRNFPKVKKINEAEQGPYRYK